MQTDTIIWHPVTSLPQISDTYLVTFILDRSGERFVLPMEFDSYSEKFIIKYDGKVRAWALMPKPYEG